MRYIGYHNCANTAICPSEYKGIRCFMKYKGNNYRTSILLFPYFTCTICGRLCAFASIVYIDSAFAGFLLIERSFSTILNVTGLVALITVLPILSMIEFKSFYYN